MKSIYLFRHAESDWNLNKAHLLGGRSNHTPLTLKGEEQAERLGFWIANRKLRPDVVYVSPAVRTLETMRIALANAGIIHEPVVDDRLQELTHGLNEGRIRSEVYTTEIIERVSRELKDFKLDGGESVNEVAVRKKEFVRDVLAGPHNIIFAFTHGFAIRCLLGEYLAWDHETILHKVVDNASVTILNFDGNALGSYDFNINTQSEIESEVA